MRLPNHERFMAARLLRKPEHKIHLMQKRREGDEEFRERAEQVANQNQCARVILHYYGEPISDA